MGCIAAQLIKAWGGHVTATVSSRGLVIANQLGIDDVIVYDGKDSDFQSLLTSQTKFDLVVNTVGSYLHDFCKANCKEEGVIVSTVATHPASDQYGVFFGALYSLWVRLRLRFQRVRSFPFTSFNYSNQIFVCAIYNNSILCSDLENNFTR